MPTITELRTAIADAVATIDGLRCTPLVTDQINGPQAVVYRKPWTYDEVQHGPAEDSARTYLFGITVYASRTNERVGQDLLDDIAEPTGDRSLKQAVESDSDLDALVDWAIVTAVDEVKVVTIGTVDYLMEDFAVQVGVSP